MPAKCGPCDKRWARLQGSNDGCMRVKRWNSVWCSIPLINRSIRVYSSLPSQCRDEFFSYWLYHSMLTRTGRPSAPSNQYGLIMPLRPDTHQTVIFSTLSGWYWWPLGWTLPRHWKKWSPRNQDCLPFADWWFVQRYGSQAYLHRYDSCKICIFYASRWRSSCVIPTIGLLGLPSGSFDPLTMLF